MSRSGEKEDVHTTAYAGRSAVVRAWPRVCLNAPSPPDPPISLRRVSVGRGKAARPMGDAFGIGIFCVLGQIGPAGDCFVLCCMYCA